MYATDPEETIVPIFAKEKYTDKLHQIGTGIFVDVQGLPFLYTAAHVTDKLQHGELMVPTHSGIEPIEGYLAHVDLPPEIPRNKDDIDIAYYRLSTEFARTMAAIFRPLPQSRCMIINSALELGACSIYGFPSSRAIQRQGKYTSESATYRGMTANKETYEELGLSPDTSIVIHFHKKRAMSPESGLKINPISPKGVSGGGIFAWPEGQELSGDWSLPKLVGIFHTYKKPEGLMIGTHLISVLASIQLGQMKEFGGVA